MSLINQMLRDLEQRRPDNTAPMATPATLAVTKPPRWPGSLVALALLAVLVGLAYVFWPAVEPVKPAPVVAMASSAVIPLVTEPATQAVLSQPAESVPVKPVLATEAAATPSPKPPEIVPVASAMGKQPSPLPVQQHSHPSRGNGPDKARSPRNSASNSPGAIERLQLQARQAVSLAMRKEIYAEILELSPQDLKTRDQMLDVLLKTASAAELESFLRDSLLLFPKHLAFVTSYARLQLQQKNVAAAITTLERVGADASREPAYLSLLASSYQQQQRFHEAAPLYQSLTQLQPEKAEYWLGLAICADNLQQPYTAIQAYQQALGQKTLKAEVSLYIQQRLDALK